MKRILVLSAAALCSLNSCNSSSGLSPQLISKAHTTAWGPPKIESGPSNTRRLVYTNPRNVHDRFIVESRSSLYGSPTHAPGIWHLKLVNGKYEKTSTPQVWKLTNIAGQKVRWYQEYYPHGDKPAIFKTRGFQLTHPDGRKGNYRIEGEGSESDFRSRLSKLSWQ